MSQGQASAASRRVLALFLGTTLAPAAGLLWLGWRMLEQDRALERQREQERREHAADLAAAALQRVLDEAERQGSRGGLATVVFGPEGQLHHSGEALPFYPALPPAPEAPGAVFAEAEALEFRGSGPAAAIRVLHGLAGAKDPAVRAEALVRLARNHRKAGDAEQALAALAELSRLDPVRVNGLPAGLLARQGTALVYEALGRRNDLLREADRLDTELHAGRWQLTRAAYEFAKEQAHRWLGGDPRESKDRLALAEAAEAVWKEWQARGREGSDSAVRSTVRAQGQSVLALWRGSKEKLSVTLAGRQFLESAWLKELGALRSGQRLEFALTDAEGGAVLGQPQAPPTRQSVRTASATRLPWTVHVISGADPGAGEWTGRSRMLAAGIAMIAVLVLGGGYLVYRSISREVQVARLQTDFVAAVSHEFRTPLTTMRQLSEMLVQDRVSSENRRRQFYDVLLQESDRLHRLVEGLLHFGQMEAGRIQYRFEPVDAGALLGEVVGEFRREASKNGYEVELLANDGTASIRADRDSLARVFWNLLDNAVKYSPECRKVWVEVAGADGRVAVRVRDQGLGIPPEEQRAIFGRFVRGAGSRAAAIQGTGLGLAIARQIVEAHGGEISVESKPGQGSVFTVLLPGAGEAP